MKKIICLIVIIFLISILTTLFAGVGYKEYVVQEDDTFMSICEEQLLDCDAQWKQFLSYNELNKPTDVVPGMVLKIPNSLSKDRYAKVQFIIGDVEVLINADEDEWEKIRNNHVLIEGNVLRTGEESKCEVKLDDGTILKLSEETAIILGEFDFDGDGANTLLEILDGTVLMKVTKLGDNDSFNVSTPSAVAGVRGTEFVVSVEEDDVVEVKVLEGTVATSMGDAEMVFSGNNGNISTEEIAKNGTGSIAVNDEVISVETGYTIVFNKADNLAVVTQIPGQIENVEVEEVENE